MTFTLKVNSGGETGLLTSVVWFLFPAGEVLFFFPRVVSHWIGSYIRTLNSFVYLFIHSSNPYMSARDGQDMN